MNLKITGLILALSVALSTASQLSDNSIVRQNAGGVAEFCRDKVDEIRQGLADLASENDYLKAAWDFWECLGNRRIQKDLYALCDLLGKAVPDIPKLEMFGNYFVQKQTNFLCTICQKGPDYPTWMSDKNLAMAVEWLATRVENPAMASAIRQNGKEFVARAMKGLIPGFDFDPCSYLTDYCDGQPGRFNKIFDMVEGVLENVTRCVECNLCDNVLLFVQMEILPNRNLSTCIVTAAKTTLCAKLLTIPKLEFAYDICVSVIEHQIGDILSTVNTLLHTNFVCGTVAHVCDNEYGINMFECMCDTVKLPSFLSWIMPCK